MIITRLFPIFLSWNLLDSKGTVKCDILSHSKECKILIDNFANASASFVSCILQNARPVQMCCSCASAYNSALESFNNIIKSQPTSLAQCEEKLLNQDRLAVFESSVAYFRSIWIKAQCNNCLEKRSDDVELSNNTKEFQKFFQETNVCLAKHYIPSNKTYNKNVCQNCSTEYFKMNKFYSHLKKISGNGNMCMDIVDAMNITRHLWSNFLHCGKTVLTFEWQLILSCITVLTLPIAFYLGALKFSKTRSAAILHRNRLSQRFGERWRNRASSSLSN